MIMHPAVCIILLLRSAAIVFTRDVKSPPAGLAAELCR